MGHCQERILKIMNVLFSLKVFDTFFAIEQTGSDRLHWCLPILMLVVFTDDDEKFILTKECILVYCDQHKISTHL
uniref:Uncharacterized LOC101241959 n=1 Tax=Ciona intestinalis TaxID=7719 RepID=H2XW07_CIOIN